MAVEYIYKNKKPIAQIWTKNKIGIEGIVAGVIVAGIVVAGVAWWYSKQSIAGAKQYSWVKAAQGRKEIPKSYKCGEPGVICF